MLGYLMHCANGRWYLFMENGAAFVTDSYKEAIREGHQFPPFEVYEFKGELDIAEVMHLTLDLQREGAIKRTRED